MEIQLEMDFSIICCNRWRASLSIIKKPVADFHAKNSNQHEGWLYQQRGLTCITPHTLQEEHKVKVVFQELVGLDARSRSEFIEASLQLRHEASFWKKMSLPYQECGCHLQLSCGIV